MRVVLDTNIFVSALISTDGYAAQTFDLWTHKKYDLVTSLNQLDELRRVSGYEHLRGRFRPADMGKLVNALRYKALVVENLPELDVSPDPDDNAILATGVAGGVQYIVSGDKSHMLDLVKVRGIPILTARRFVELFGSS